MIDDSEDLYEVIKNISEEQKLNLFKIKYTKYLLKDLDFDSVISITTTLLKENDKYKKTISKQIVKEVNVFENVNVFEEENIKYKDDFEKIENIHLNNLKNNYYSVESENEGYWVLEYNNLFRIVGSINQRPLEIFEVEKLLEEVLDKEDKDE